MAKPKRETKNPILLILALEKKGIITKEEGSKILRLVWEDLGIKRWANK